MHSVLRFFFASAALGLASALPSARAQLSLTGTASGAFIDPSLPNTTVVNGPVVSTFASGIPYRVSDTKTSIKYTGSSFADIGDGDWLDLGGLKITNGVTLLGSTAKTASMDLFLNLNGQPSFKLTTLLFGIDSTANDGVANVPDLFLIGHGDVNALSFGGRKLTFDFHLTNPAFGIGSGASIAEGKSGTDGIYAIVHFSPVPEASTYAMFGVLLVGGVAATRRMRRQPLAA